MSGHWLVTSRTLKSHRFKTSKSLLHFLRKHPASLVSWIKS